MLDLTEENDCKSISNEDIDFETNKKRLRFEENKNPLKKQKPWPLKEKNLGLLLQNKLEKVLEEARRSEIGELDSIGAIGKELTETINKFNMTLKCIKTLKEEKINRKIQEAHDEYNTSLRNLGIKLSQCGVCLDEFRDPNLVPTPCGHKLCMSCYKRIQYHDNGEICFRCPTCRRIHTTIIPSKLALDYQYLDEDDAVPLDNWI